MWLLSLHRVPTPYRLVLWCQHLLSDRAGAHGGGVELHFCPDCGTTLFSYVEFLPDHVGIAFGTFADPLPRPTVSVWEMTRQATVGARVWIVRLPAERWRGHEALLFAQDAAGGLEALIATLAQLSVAAGCSLASEQHAMADVLRLDTRAFGPAWPNP